MLDKLNKKALFSDLVKVATFNIVANFLMYLRFSEPLLDEKFINSLVFILIGFTTYYILLDYQVLDWVRRQYKYIKETGVRKTVSNLKEKVTSSINKNLSS